MSLHEDHPPHVPARPSCRRRTLLTAAATLPVTALATGSVACQRTTSGMPSPETLSRSLVSRQGSHLLLAGRPWRPVGVNLPWSFGWGGNKCPSAAEHDQLFKTLLPGSVLRLWAFGNWTPRRIRQLVDQGRPYGHKFVLTLADYHGATSGERWVHAAGRGSSFTAGKWKQRSGWRDLHLMPMLEMFAGDPAVFLWEPINEPEIRDPNLANFMDETSSLIRTHAPNQLIGTGTTSNYGQPSQMQQLNQLPNIDVASMHEYDERQAPSHWTAGDAKLAADENKPLLIGESGITTQRAGSRDARADLIRGKIEAASRIEGVAAYIYWSAASAKSIKPQDYEISCSEGPEINALARSLD